MGIDYYTCANCSDNFADCSDYYRSCPTCSECFCHPDCAQLKYLDEEEEDEEGRNCVICRGEVISDSTLLTFLLDKYSLTREKAKEMYRMPRFETPQIKPLAELIASDIPRGLDPEDVACLK